jgi:transposase InsO family protein
LGKVHESLGIKLIHSSSYHPQTDGQMERVNQIKSIAPAITPRPMVRWKE